MNNNQVLVLFTVCMLAGFLRSTATPNCNLSALARYLKFMDELIREVIAVLKWSYRRQPGPSDCSQILNEGHTESGIYRVWPQNWQFMGSFQVYCDMETGGGGWTVIQRRGEYNQPLDYFYKTWIEYQRGFGNLSEDFWLGNNRIFSLTDQGKYSLYIDMEDEEGEKRFAFYGEFWVENEMQLYKLHVSKFTGNAGDSFSGMNGMSFTTKDMDNDIHSDNCAEIFKGGWWYTKCHSSNLNGLHYKGPHESYADGVNWKGWKGHHHSLTKVEMKIRPV